MSGLRLAWIVARAIAHLLRSELRPRWYDVGPGLRIFTCARCGMTGSAAPDGTTKVISALGPLCPTFIAWRDLLRHGYPVARVVPKR